MMKAMQEDWDTRFKKYVESGEMCLQMLMQEIKKRQRNSKKRVQAAFPGMDIHMDPTFFKCCMPYRTWSTCSCMFKESDCKIRNDQKNEKTYGIIWQKNLLLHLKKQDTIRATEK